MMLFTVKSSTSQIIKYRNSLFEKAVTQSQDGPVTQTPFRTGGSFTLGVSWHRNLLLLWSEFGKTLFRFFSCRITRTLVRSGEITCNKNEGCIRLVCRQIM